MFQTMDVPATPIVRRGSVSLTRRDSVAIPRVVEFYSGIGGMHFALKHANLNAMVVAAFDINDHANKVYAHNFQHKPQQRNIEALSVDHFERLRGDIFVMSPPCQPYTRTGKQQGSADARAQSLFYILHLLDALRHKPTYILLENVKGFEKSDTRDAVIATLLRNQYTYREFLITPTQLDMPNSRLRYYLLAKRSPLTFVDEPTYSILSYIPGHPLAGPDSALQFNADGGLFGLESEEQPASKRARIVPTAPMQAKTRKLSEFLEPLTPQELNELKVPDIVLWKSGEVCDIVKSDSRHSCCFTKAYGHYVEGTGSLIQMNQNIDTDDMYSIYRSIRATKTKNSTAPWPPSFPCPLLNLELRYFSPREVANLLGFPRTFSFPPEINRKQQYKLLGNSLNVHVVGALLAYMMQEGPPRQEHMATSSEPDVTAAASVALSSSSSTAADKMTS